MLKLQSSCAVFTRFSEWDDAVHGSARHQLFNTKVRQLSHVVVVLNIHVVLYLFLCFVHSVKVRALGL